MGPDTLKVLSNVRCTHDDDYDSECLQPPCSPPHAYCEKLAIPTTSRRDTCPDSCYHQPLQGTHQPVPLPYLKSVPCNQMGGCPNCHHRAVTQYLMETEAEIRSQALGRALGAQLKRGRKDYIKVCGGVKIMMGNPKETTDLSLWELTDSGQTAREPA